MIEFNRQNSQVF